MNPILKTALTYLDNTDKLIYSYGGNTFLRNGELTDAKHGGRGGPVLAARIITHDI